MELARILIKLLWPHSARWHSFSLDQYGDRGGWAKVWMEGSMHLKRLPILDTLSLSLFPFCMCSADTKAIGAVYSLFRNCPMLTSLSIRGFPNYEAVNGMALRHPPWENMRKVAIFAFEPPPNVFNHIPGILSRLKNVTLLRLITDTLPTRVVASHSVQLSFPNLIGFDLDAPNLTTPLADFVAPSLEALRLAGSFIVHDLTGFVVRSQCRIQHLYIEELSDDDFADILPELPALRVLSIEQASFGACTQIVQQLGQTRTLIDEGGDRSKPLCPELAALSLSLAHRETVSPGDEDSLAPYLVLPEAIANLLEVRWPRHRESATGTKACRPSPTPLLNFVTSGVDVRRVAGGDSVLERIRKAAEGTKKASKEIDERGDGEDVAESGEIQWWVNVDIAFDRDSDWGGVDTALWPDLWWEPFKPELPPDSAISRLAKLAAEDDVGSSTALDFMPKILA